MAVLLLNNNNCLYVKTTEKIESMIINFINIASKRKRLDERYFTELTWIENWLEKMNKTLGVFNNEEYIKANKLGI